ncbi:MAG: ATPase domain-containing protein [Candidatus Binatus sp.]
MAALPKLSWSDPSSPVQALRLPSHIPLERPQPFEFSGVFRGHELTRKDRRLSSGLAPLDALIDGGIPRGRISEITGRAGSGKTSIAASFAAFATRRGEVAAWLDASGAFDPESMAAAGVELGRMLWASMKTTTASRMARATPPYAPFAAGPLARHQSAIVKAAELVLEAGGFGLVVVDFGEAPRALAHASALRIARAAERSGAAVIAIAPWRMCGTFAALSLAASRAERSFSRLAPGSPVMFDGLAVDAMVARNKLGGTGQRVRVRALIDPVPIPDPTGLHPQLRVSASS